MKNCKNINFLIIGAQKSATTSLFKYLSNHPEIYMPPEKEINFFSDDLKYKNGINYYLEEFFGSVNGTKILGEASPEYMSEKYIPERIYNYFPDIKLIASLRNPIERALSHYRMLYRRGIIRESFEESINKIIENKNYEEPNSALNKILQNGEYGRILSNYLNYFPKQNIKILFVDHLIQNSKKLMEELYKFLGCEIYYAKNVGKKYNVGGDKRFPIIDRIINSNISKNIIRSIINPQLRRKIGFWYITQFTVKPNIQNKIDNNARLVLTDYYKNDVVLLENLFNISTPWPDFNPPKNI